MRLFYFATLALVFTLTNCTPDSTTQIDCLAKEVAGSYICQDVKLNGGSVSTLTGIESFSAISTDCNQIKFVFNVGDLDNGQNSTESFEAETTETGTGQIAGGDNVSEFSYNPVTKIVNVTYKATNGDTYVMKATKQ